jgi:hypothetical protein
MEIEEEPLARSVVDMAQFTEPISMCACPCMFLYGMGR